MPEHVDDSAWELTREMGAFRTARSIFMHEFHT